MSILKRVKTALRLTTDKFDDGELTPIIEAGKLDLKLAGVVNIDEDDPLIGRALVLYAKAHFGNMEGAERFEAAYTLLKIHLAISSKYRTEVS